MNMWEMLVRAADLNLGAELRFIERDSTEEVFGYRELIYRAQRTLAFLQGNGVGVGDHLILQIQSEHRQLEIFWACVLGGIIPVLVPKAVALREKSEGRQRLAGILELFASSFVVVDDTLQNLEANSVVIKGNLKSSHLIVDDPNGGNPRSAAFYVANLDDLAYLQFSSGSTGKPKGVRITHRNVLSNIRDIVEAADLKPDDVTLNWMPYFHDMGLIGFHLVPTFLGINQINIRSIDFVADPNFWLHLISTHRASLVGCPNFGLQHVIERVSVSDIKKFDLSCVRRLFNGAEPISAPVMRRFLGLVEHAGFKRSSMLPVYGLAEACLGVTFSPVNEEPLIHCIDREILVNQGVAKATPPEADVIEYVDLGSPLPSVQIRIVNETGEEVGECKIGEVQIRGDNVTSGYEARSDDSWEELLFASGGWLRTGDIGFLKNRRLVVAGRLKDIIFVNGRNVMAADLERMLCEKFDLSELSVAACGTTDHNTGSDRVSIFVVTRQKGDFWATLHNIGSAAEEYLKYPVDAVIPINRLPLTSSGKVQRHKLRMQLEGDLFVSLRRAYLEYKPKTLSPFGCIPLEGEMEQVLGRIWCEVLGVESIGRQDNFFELGGHSLSAMQVLARIELELKRKVAFQDVFKSPIFREFARLVGCAPIYENTIITLADRKNQLGLSHAQRRVWFLDQLEHTRSAYIIPVVLKIGQSVDQTLLQKTLDTIVARHEILRTAIVVVSGKPVQVIADQAHFPLSFVNLSGLPNEMRDTEIQRFFNEERDTPFDLERGPLVRGRLLRTSEDNSLVLITLHHIIADGWSVGVLVREIEVLYTAFQLDQPNPLPALEVQYADYSAWQLEQATRDQIRISAEYWRRELIGAPELTDIPTDYPRPAISNFDGGHRSIVLPTSLVERLRSLAGEKGITLFSVLLTALKVLLCRWSNESDITIGTVLSGRDHLVTESLIGCFVNFVPLRSKNIDNGNVDQLLESVASKILEAHENQRCPFDEIVRYTNVARSAAHNPIFNVALLLQEDYIETVARRSRSREREVEKTSFVVEDVVEIKSKAALLDLRFVAENRPDAFSVCCEYREDIFNVGTIAELLDSYRACLEWILESRHLTVSEFSIPNGLGNKSEVRDGKIDLILNVASSFVADSIDESLRFWVAKLKKKARIKYASYGQVFQEILNPSGAFSKNSRGLNVVLFRFEDWLQCDILENDEAARRDSIERKIEIITGELCDSVKNYVAINTAPLIILSCPSSRQGAEMQVDTYFIRRAEQELSACIAEFDEVCFVDSSTMVQRHLVNQWCDFHADEIAHVPYTREGFAAISSEIARQAYSLVSEPYKVLVFDCDETLWRGVCGEDAPENLILDPGRRALHELAVKLHKAGVLLCVCSKNNEQDVWEVFERRSDFLLKRSHFAGARINWSSKSENLVSLANELGLSLDSFVFVDDNPLECAEVEANCPQVLVLQMPSDETKIEEYFQNVWAFDRRMSTSEARLRTSYYQSNKDRDAALLNSGGFDKFLESLELEVSVQPIRDEQIRRVAELIARTNQFNASTIRRNALEVRKLVREERVSCDVVHVRDRFGDYGLTGVVIHSVKNNSLEIETLLLSCRVLGRGVEHQLFNYLAKVAVENKCDQILIPYVRSAKNQPILEFLSALSEDHSHLDDLSHTYCVSLSKAADARFKSDHGFKIQSGQRKELISSASDGLGREMVMLLRDIALGLYSPANVIEIIDKGGARRASCFDDYVAPATATEEKLAAIWQRVLRIDLVGRQQDFFELGGDSLLAVQVISQIRREFAVEIDLSIIFLSPTIRELADAVMTELIASYEDNRVESIMAEIDVLSVDEIEAILAQERY